MNAETPLARSSMVPVLGCVALLLFGLNFHEFLKRHVDRLFGQWRCHTHVHVAVEHMAHGEGAADFFLHFEDETRVLRREERHLRRELRRAERELHRLRDLEFGSQSARNERERHELELVTAKAQLALLRARLEGQRHHQHHRHPKRCGTQDRHPLEIHFAP